MKKNRLTFSVKKDEDGSYTAQCIEFPGIITQADTKRQLKAMINDAISGYSKSFPEEKERLPLTQKSEVLEIIL